jgi:murein L,D-transpeptidase YcbB/YkuD
LQHERVAQEEITLVKIIVFAVAATCASAIAGQAAAQESAMDFWRQEWQRQQAPRQAQPSQFGRQYGFPPPSWSRQAYGNSDWMPSQQSAPREAPARPMPQVHVDNPDFYNYAPDRLKTASLTKICAARSDAVAQAPKPDESTDKTGNAETTGAAVADNAQPAPSPFAQACANSPSLSVRVLPQVGDALIAYYSAHQGFLWSQDGKVSAKAVAAIAFLGASDKFGLDPADYRVTPPDLNATNDADRPKALLQFDLALSAKMLTYTLDATRGRIDPNRISGYHDLPRKSVDLAAALGDMAKSDDIAASLASRNPDNPQFRALVAELAKLQGNAPKALAPIPERTRISPGESDPQLAKVLADIQRVASGSFKKEHADAFAKAAQAKTYSPEFVALVRAFQKEKGLSPDGTIGKNTIKAITGGNTGNAEKVEKLRLALERLRWLPRQLGSTYVFLNEAGYEVTFVDGDKKPLTMRAVVGKPTAQTYFFTDHIKDVEFNPYWSVPRSIVVNEMLPKLYRNPGYLSAHGYEVSNQRGVQVASNSVNWAAVARNKLDVEVRQPPGLKNALGQLKIEFPNKHAIYMHDTPEKHLFAHDKRAFSHGCVRLQYPREMAAALLGKDVRYIDKRIGSGRTESDKVARDIPVYLAYFTAWPDTNGTMHYYDDVYDRDAHLRTALAKTETERRAN